MTARKLVIVGTSGHARELHQLVEDINASPANGGNGQAGIEFLGWLDSNALTHGTTVHDLPVLGDVDWLTEHPDVEVVVGIGSPPVRRRVVERIKALGHQRFGQLLHPKAMLGNRIEYGEGTVICAGVVGTTDFQIGNHVLININATVTHDNVLGDFVTIAPGAKISGNVTIGEGTDVGTNATVIQGIGIGAWSVIGAGAVVTRLIPRNVTAVGAPAKVIKERAEGWHL